MKNKGNFRAVTLRDLWRILIHKLWIILLIVVLLTGGLFAVNRLSFTPHYASTATLYVLKQNDDSSSTNVSSDFSLALNVVNDCTYLLKSHAVLDQVISELNLDTSYNELYESISTANPDKTRILEVTVEAGSPELAKEIVDAVCVIGTDKIKDAMGFKQVNLYEYGIIDRDPCNMTGIITYILLAFVFGIVSYTAFVLAFLLDDSLQTDEEIEYYLGLSILADIPDAENPNKKAYGYYSAKGRSEKNKGNKGGK